VSSGCSPVRRGRPWPVLALSVLALAGCATSPAPRAPAPPDVRSPHVGVTVPATAAGFDLVDTSHYAEADLGSSWRYRSPSHPELWVDAYVYRPGIWSDDAGALADLSAQVKHDIQMAVDQGIYSDVEMLNRVPLQVDVAGVSLAGLHLRMAMTMDGQAMISHAHLFYLPPYTVKFRSSFPAYGNTSFDERIDQLVAAFLAGFKLDPAIRCRAIVAHRIAGGEPAWVSKDGRDMFVPAGLDETSLLKLTAHAAALAERAGCPRAAETAPVAAAASHWSILAIP
jgi:hypothetical protein